jgi:hypothetical protein
MCPWGDANKKNGKCNYNALFCARLDHDSLELHVAVALWCVKSSLLMTVHAFVYWRIVTEQQAYRGNGNGNANKLPPQAPTLHYSTTENKSITQYERLRNTVLKATVSKRLM